MQYETPQPEIETYQQTNDTITFINPDNPDEMITSDYWIDSRDL